MNLPFISVHQKHVTLFTHYVSRGFKKKKKALNYPSFQCIENMSHYSRGRTWVFGVEGRMKEGVKVVQEDSFLVLDGTV